MPTGRPAPITSLELQLGESSTAMQLVDSARLNPARDALYTPTAGARKHLPQQSVELLRRDHASTPTVANSQKNSRPQPSSARTFSSGAARPTSRDTPHTTARKRMLSEGGALVTSTTASSSMPWLPLTELFAARPSTTSSSSTTDAVALVDDQVRVATLQRLLLPSSTMKARQLEQEAQAQWTRTSSSGRNREDPSSDPDLEQGGATDEEEAAMFWDGNAVTTGPSLSANETHESKFVERLVTSFAAFQKQQQQQQVVRVSRSSADSKQKEQARVKVHIEHRAPMMNAVLSVNKEFEKHTLQDVPAASAARTERHFELASACQTKIPSKFWVYRDAATAALAPSIGSPTSHFHTNSNHHQGDQDTLTSLNEARKRLLFPSTAPSNRPEAILLANALDGMLNELHDVEILLDPRYAYGIIPASDVTAAQTLLESSTSRRGEHPSSSSVAGTGENGDKETIGAKTEASATQRLSRYTDALRRFWNVFDCGLSELVRQIAPQCIERAALLDALRQSSFDIAQTMADVVAYCKERAYSEAMQRQANDDVVITKNRQIIDARQRIVQLEEQKLALEALVEQNALKASRFDVIVGRMDHAEAQRQRAILRLDQVEMLHETDEAVSRSAMNAQSLFDDVATSGDTGSGGVVVESTLAKMQRAKREEEERGNKRLYEESLRMMRVLRDSVRALDNACEPLYRKMIFSKPELNMRVSASRWTAIAKAVGEHEALIDHRERVSKAHTQWLEHVVASVNHQQFLNDIPESGMVGAAGAASSALMPANRFVAPGAAHSAKALQVYECTSSDLLQMGITDCTPEEVNLLQTPGFDLDAYMRPPLKPPGTWGLSTVGVGQMLEDISWTFEELTSRLTALHESGMMKLAVRPMPMPPQRPGEACELCGRREFGEQEKITQKEKLDKAILEIQRREEEACLAVQNLTRERDTWRMHYDAQVTTTKRLEDEMEYLHRRHTTILSSANAPPQSAGGAEESTTNSGSPPPPAAAAPTRHSTTVGKKGTEASLNASTMHPSSSSTSKRRSADDSVANSTAANPTHTGQGKGGRSPLPSRSQSNMELELEEISDIPRVVSHYDKRKSSLTNNSNNNNNNNHEREESPSSPAQQQQQHASDLAPTAPPPSKGGSNSTSTITPTAAKSVSSMVRTTSQLRHATNKSPLPGLKSNVSIRRRSPKGGEDDMGAQAGGSRSPSRLIPTPQPLQAHSSTESLQSQQVQGSGSNMTLPRSPVSGNLPLVIELAIHCKCCGSGGGGLSANKSPHSSAIGYENRRRTAEGETIFSPLDILGGTATMENSSSAQQQQQYMDEVQARIAAAMKDSVRLESNVIATWARKHVGVQTDQGDDGDDVASEAGSELQTVGTLDAADASHPSSFLRRDGREPSLRELRKRQLRRSADYGDTGLLPTLQQQQQNSGEDRSTAVAPTSLAAASSSNMTKKQVQPSNFLEMSDEELSKAAQAVAASPLLMRPQPPARSAASAKSHQSHHHTASSSAVRKGITGLALLSARQDSASSVRHGVVLSPKKDSASRPGTGIADSDVDRELYLMVRPTADRVDARVPACLPSSSGSTTAADEAVTVLISDPRPVPPPSRKNSPTKVGGAPTSPNAGATTTTEAASPPSEATIWGNLQSNLVMRLRAAEQEMSREGSSSPRRADRMPSITALFTPGKSQGGPPPSAAMMRLTQPTKRAGSGKDSTAEEMQKMEATWWSHASKTLVPLTTNDYDGFTIEKMNACDSQNMKRIVNSVSARSFELAQSRPSIKPLSWLLQFIAEFYRAKREYDDSVMGSVSEQELKKQRELGGTPVKRSIPFSSPLQFFYIHLKHVFGSNELVTENIRNLLATARAFMNVDLRVMIFLRCLFVYSLDVATFSMQLSLALEQCSSGLTYHVNRGATTSMHLHSSAADCYALTGEYVCLQRIVQCLHVTHLAARPYVPVLWSMLAHAAVAQWSPDDAFFLAMKETGAAECVAAAARKQVPSSWDEATFALNRSVVHRASFVAIATYLEAIHAGFVAKPPPPLLITDGSTAKKVASEKKIASSLSDSNAGKR